MERHRPARPLTKTGHLILVIATGLLTVTVACGDAETPVPSATPAATSASISSPIPTPTVEPVLRDFVRVDKVDFPVELAVNPDERIKGLSGRAFLSEGTGMLFIFEVESRLRFWMREMEFPLDMIWIGAKCQVVDISVDVPPPEPETSLNDLPRYSPSAPAMYVLEINGGEAETLGLGAGDPVEFRDGLAGRYGC